MPRKKPKTREELTLEEIEEFLSIEEAARIGDQEAINKLAVWEDLEEYRAAAAEYIENSKKLADSISGMLDAKESLHALNNAFDEVTKEALHAFKANSIVPDSLKGIFDYESFRNLINTPDIEQLRAADIWKELNEKIEPPKILTEFNKEVVVPPAYLYYERPEDRIAEELAESNRLNRAILEELRKSGQMGGKTPSMKIELHVSVLDFLDWLNNWFLSKEWNNAMPSLEEVDDGYTCFGKPERKFDGAIIPVSIKKDRRWLDYKIQLLCQELSGNLTEIALYYSPEIETAVVDLVIAANKNFRIPAGSEPGKGLSEDSHSKLVGYTPEQRQSIDEACIGWAGRGYLPSGSFNMSEYLNEFFRGKNIYLTVDQFKEALKDAGNRGLIEKVNSRWRLPGTRP